MKEITEEEYALYKKLLKSWLHSDPDRFGSFFICGEAGERDKQGLPKKILICPQMGSDEMVIYSKCQ